MQKPSNYFEGVLQLRTLSNEIIDFARSEITREGKAHIAKEKKLKTGVDFWVSSQHHLQNVGKKLKEKFGGILEVSCRLHTKSHLTSKELYRVSVLFKSVPFKKGDIIKFVDEEWKILLINNQVQLQNTKTGQKKWVKIDIVEQATKV
ncbi:hypothetical protein HY485_00170 [Candidatus Woesearchaeota archaeon]|nr:hypothetical protein [Candidatus Woesearchaeota archaeon]